MVTNVHTLHVLVTLEYFREGQIVKAVGARLLYIYKRDIGKVLPPKHTHALENKEMPADCHFCLRTKRVTFIKRVCVLEGGLFPYLSYICKEE